MDIAFLNSHQERLDELHKFVNILDHEFLENLIDKKGNTIMHLLCLNSKIKFDELEELF